MFHKVILLPGKKPPVNVLLWLLSTVRQRDYAVFPEKQNKTNQTKPNKSQKVLQYYVIAPPGDFSLDDKEEIIYIFSFINTDTSFHC